MDPLKYLSAVLVNMKKITTHPTISLVSLELKGIYDSVSSA